MDKSFLEWYKNNLHAVGKCSNLRCSATGSYSRHTKYRYTENNLIYNTDQNKGLFELHHYYRGGSGIPAGTVWAGPLFAFSHS